VVSKAECLSRFDDAMSLLKAHFQKLEASVPPPVPTRVAQGLELRYREPLIQHAILMKLARLISIVGGMRTLVDRGFIAEQGILQRTADETDEDIFFLAFGQQNGLKRIHKQYLRQFWREEFETSTAPADYRFRGGPRRHEIREYVNEQAGAGRAQADEVGRFVYGVFSGYVHGASTHIYELLYRDTRTYRLSGVHDDADRQGYLHNALNYPYRALMAGVIAARSLGMRKSADVLFNHVKEYEAWFNKLP
jgi:hypothetical protein